MFGFLKKKRKLTPAEDLSAVINMIFDRLSDADRKAGIADIDQLFAINLAFGTTIPLIREYFPNVPIEDDGPAMVALSAGADGPDWKSIDIASAYMLEQVRSCPNDSDSRNILIRSFLAPNYMAEKMTIVEKEASVHLKEFQGWRKKLDI